MIARRGRQHLRWVVIAAVMCAAGILAVVDQGLKTSDAAGFIPSNATWRVWSPDLPAFWSSMQSHVLWQRTRPELLPLARAVELRLTRAAGVRPTPNRMRLWLGDRVLVGAVGDDVGFSVRPGVLMRVVLYAASWRGTQDARGTNRFRDVSWAWRDGFLILSTSPAYVAGALESSAPLRFGAEGADAVDVAMMDAAQAEPYFQLRMRADPDLPVDGMLRVDAVSRPPGPVLHYESPLPSMMFVSCGDLRGLTSVVNSIVDRSPEVAALEAVDPFAREALDYFVRVNGLAEFDWDMIGDREVTLVLPEFQPGVLPLPVIAMEIVRNPGETQHPLEALVAPTSPIEHEWSGYAGVLAPVWGEAVTLCLAPRGNVWIAATTEPLMAQMMALEAAPAYDGTAQLVVEVYWARVASALRDVTSHWSELELTQGRSDRRLRDRAQRLSDVLTKVGSTRILGTFDGESLRFHGGLARTAAPA